MPGTRNINRPNTYNRKSYTEKLAFANRRIKKEYIAKAASKLGVSKKAVMLVLDGAVQDNSVMNQVYNLTRNRKDTLV